MGCFKSINGGESWSAANNGLTNTYVGLSIDTSNPATLYAGTYGGGMFKTTLIAACKATIDENLLLYIPFISHNAGDLSLWADLVYEFNPAFPTLLSFNLTNYGILNNPTFSCVASTLYSDLTIHIPDVLLPDGSTHLWVDFEYSAALSTNGTFYWVVSNYGILPASI